MALSPSPSSITDINNEPNVFIDKKANAFPLIGIVSKTDWRRSRAVTSSRLAKRASSSIDHERPISPRNLSRQTMRWQKASSLMLTAPYLAYAGKAMRGDDVIVVIGVKCAAHVLHAICRRTPRRASFVAEVAFAACREYIGGARPCLASPCCLMRRRPRRRHHRHQHA